MLCNIVQNKRKKSIKIQAGHHQGQQVHHRIELHFQHHSHPHHLKGRSKMFEIL